MHYHLIVSRKDQANKKEVITTNHKNTKNEISRDGFDRMNLLQQAEQEFDKRFSYNQQQTESLDYLNTMKNNSPNSLNKIFNPVKEKLKSVMVTI